MLLLQYACEPTLVTSAYLGKELTKPGEDSD